MDRDRKLQGLKPSISAPWPTPSVQLRYRQALAMLPAIGYSKLTPWPPVSQICRELYLSGISDFGSRQPVKDDLLREISAVASMIAHLTRGKDGEPVNVRRKRQPYTTYPTAPSVGAAAAKYILRRLSEKEFGGRRPIIIDPTMEGGPFLLELALALRASKTANSLKPHLLGVDQNRALAPFVRSLLERARADAGRAYSFSIHASDAFDVLESHDSFDALANNPPWGAGIDGIHGSDLASKGPYVGYREPLIAFVSLGVRKLRPGAPFALVIPSHLLTSVSAAGLREELEQKSVLDAVFHLPTKAFPRLTMYTSLLLGRRRLNGRRCSKVLIHFCDTQWRKEQFLWRDAPKAGRFPWAHLVTEEVEPLSQVKVTQVGAVSRILSGVEPYHAGRGVPPQSARVVRTQPFTFHHPGIKRVPIVRGRNVNAFSINGYSEYLAMGPQLAYVGSHMNFIHRPRVFVRELCSRDGRLTAAVAIPGVLARRGIFTIVCTDIDPIILCALLNSSWVAQWVRTTCPGFRKESFGRIAAPDLRRLPIPSGLIKSRGLSVFKRALKDKIKRFLVNHAKHDDRSGKIVDMTMSNLYIRASVAAT